MLDISPQTLNILQFKEIAIQPYIEIKSSTNYIYRLSTDSDIVSKTTYDIPQATNDFIYPLIQKLPKIRQSIDITDTRMFTVSDLRISILDTEWDNFKFSDVILDHPIYNQEFEYFLWPRTVSFDDKISLYKGFVTNIRKQGDYVVLTIKDDAGVSDTMIPRKRINQTDLEFNINHGKPVPFAYGECNAYAMLTDMNGQDMNCQCDTKDQYQNIKEGPELNDETTEVLKIASTEEGYYRIRRNVSAPGGGIGDIIVGNWCNTNVNQYENKPWGCVISGEQGSPFRFNTLFTSYRATSMGGGSFCDYVPGPSYVEFDNIYNNEQYKIRYRPASVQGMDELNDIGYGYVYIENYDADNSTDDTYSYGISNSGNAQDYRIGLNINLTQPTLTKALSKPSMVNGVFCSFSGAISAGFTNTGDETQQQLDRGKLIHFRVNADERYDEDEEVVTQNPVIYSQQVTYNASSEDGIGYSSFQDPAFASGMTIPVQRPVEALYIDLKENTSFTFASSMWLAVSWVVADYRFFFEDVRNEDFFVETMGRLDTVDYKYTGGNEVRNAYKTNDGKFVFDVYRYGNGNKKIPVQVAYNRSAGLNAMQKFTRATKTPILKVKARTSPGKHIKNKLTKKVNYRKLDILDSKASKSIGSTLPKKDKY